MVHCNEGEQYQILNVEILCLLIKVSLRYAYIGPKLFPPVQCHLFKVLSMAVSRVI